MAFQTACTLVPPTSICQREHSPDAIECSIHTLPKQLMREFDHVFGTCYVNFESDAMEVESGGLSSNAPNELLAIPTNQRAREDLVGIGDHIEKEKDRLLNVFHEFGDYLCRQLRARGYWADYIDPCSGLPMLTLHCNKVYSEVDGMECLLNYKAYNAGFCKILTHPKWGSSVYPATVFAYAPSSIVIELFNQFPRAPAIIPKTED